MASVRSRQWVTWNRVRTGSPCGEVAAASEERWGSFLYREVEAGWILKSGPVSGACCFSACREWGKEKGAQSQPPQCKPDAWVISQRTSPPQLLLSPNLPTAKRALHTQQHADPPQLYLLAYMELKGPDVVFW